MTYRPEGRAPWVRALVLLAPCLALAAPALADTGDTAWILTATALVLFMTLPGLALFYGGLVQGKNLLSVLAQCIAIACLMSILWVVAGYSIAFGEGNAFWGGLGKAFLGGIAPDAVVGTLPESVFVMFQMAFAIITPALIVGAYAERVSFAAVLVFSGAWLLLVYAPVAHWVWGGGWLAGMGVSDFAGGLVVHATAGVSALVFVMIMGKRAVFPTELRPPHNPAYVMLGASMLWVGWYGFNAGSALGANASAGQAMLVTHISASTAALVWMAIEWVKFGKPTLVGIATGTIAGLATITPAAGSVGPAGALVIGTLASLICYAAVVYIRGRLKIDDSLDVFAVHGVGGILGTLSIPLLAGFGPMAPGLGGMSFADKAVAQLTGVAAVCVYTAAVSAGILYVMKQVMKLRVGAEDEANGLDSTTHGESAAGHG